MCYIEYDKMFCYYHNWSLYESCYETCAVTDIRGVAINKDPGFVDGNMCLFFWCYAENEIYQD